MKRRCPVVYALMLLAALVAASPARLVAVQTVEELTATPDSAARLYLRAVRAIRWNTVARLLHAETLEVERRYALAVYRTPHLAALPAPGEAGA